jgi:hypothetical protein
MISGHFLESLSKSDRRGGSKKGKKGKKSKKAGLFALFALFAFFASNLHSSNEAHFVNVSRHQGYALAPATKCKVGRFYYSSSV